MAINEFNEPDRDTVRDRLSGDTKTILTPDEYQNRLVDFYSQTLGATGIDVDDDVDDDKDDDKDDTYVAPNIIPDQSSDGGQSVTADILDFQYDIDSVVNTNLPRSYEDHLSSIGREDKSDLSKFGIKSIEPPSKEQLQRYGATKGLSAVFGFAGLATELGASMVGGKSQKNMFGVEEFKPTGIPGVVQDFSESMRLDAYNKNKEAYTKVKANYEAGVGPVGTVGSFEDYARTQDYGFSANSRNAGNAIYREVGSRIYNGAGMIGIDQETARRIEALKLGYRPIGFDPTDPGKSESLVSTGTGKKSLSGYDEFGYHHSVKFGSAGMGRMKDAEKLAEEWGLGITETRNALADVRKRRSFTGRSIVGKNLTQLLTELRNEKQRKAAEEAKKKQQQQQQQQQSDDVVDDDVVDSGFTATPKGKDDYFASMPSGGFFTDDDNNDSDNNSSDDASSSMGDVGGDGGYATAMGGRIGMQEGDIASNQVTVKEPGFIAPDPNATKQQEIADDKPMDARNGDFIINAPAAEEAGKQDIQRMINTAITNLQEKGVDVRFGNPKINIADKVKLLVSRNEVYIPAIIAKEIGYDRLKKINNRGKREVQRRQEESQQDEKSQARGFIQKKKGDVVATADYSEGGIDATSGMLLRLTGHLKNIEQGLGEGFKYGKKSKAGDTLRHILTSGYISEDGFFNKFMSDLFDGREISENMSEENRVDLNNNKFGRLLRQKYPDRMEFTKQARQVVKDLLKGKKTEIDGVSPMLSVKAE
jgi:hypothetical protein